MPLSPGQYRSIQGVQESLVRRGWHPSIAGRLALRAADRVLGGRRIGFLRNRGVGRLQMRSLRRDLFPGLPPRPVVSGEQCVRIQETPGSETEIYSRLDDYRSRGWNVMEMPSTQGFPSVQVYWACPPGRMPMEAQNQVLASEPWGAPFYTKGAF